MELETRLLRLTESSTQTLGRFFAFEGLYKIFECVTLELPDRENETSVSRIPAGKYKCIRRTSPKYGETFILVDVECREYILMHWGNYYTNTQGCILVGNDFADINKDGHQDITYSKNTFQLMMRVLPKEFELTIIDV
jgi:hypothetical protein